MTSTSSCVVYRYDTHARRPDEDIKPIEISEADARALASNRASSASRTREIAAALVRAAEAPGFKLPILSDVAVEAMRLAGDPASSMAQLDRTIVRDPVLAARVLKVAASPAFGGRPVRTLANALQLLGAGTIRDVLYQGVMECHIFRPDHEPIARSQQVHSIAVARLAKAVCKFAGVDQSQAFVCGLLHDIGQLALERLQTHPDFVACSPAERTAVAQLVHPVLGARICEKWNLPPLALEAIRRHHRHRDWAAGAYSQIGHIVAVADCVAEHLGLGCAARPLTREELDQIQELGIDPANLVEVARTAFASGV